MLRSRLNDPKKHKHKTGKKSLLKLKMGSIFLPFEIIRENPDGGLSILFVFQRVWPDRKKKTEENPLSFTVVAFVESGSSIQ